MALFHGYTSSKSHLTYEAGYFRHLGYNVLLVDQAGNGNSAGFRTTVGYREADDVVAAVRYLRTQRPTDSLILYGVSMGPWPSCGPRQSWASAPAPTFWNAPTATCAKRPTTASNPCTSPASRWPIC